VADAHRFPGSAGGGGTSGGGSSGALAPPTKFVEVLGQFLTGATCREYCASDDPAWLAGYLIGSFNPYADAVDALYAFEHGDTWGVAFAILAILPLFDLANPRFVRHVDEILETHPQLLRGADELGYAVAHLDEAADFRRTVIRGTDPDAFDAVVVEFGDEAIIAAAQGRTSVTKLRALQQFSLENVDSVRMRRVTDVLPGH